MKKNKLFIALNNYRKPNPLANYGVLLAKTLERPAHLFGVQKVPLVPNPDALIDASIDSVNNVGIQAIKEQAYNNLEDLKHEVSQFYKHISTDLEVGFPEQTIVQKAEEENPYMVLLEGNSELTTLHEWFGTYETRIAENINAPVLVIPNDYLFQPVNTVVYLMELDDHKVSNMRLLTDVTKELEAKVEVVFLSEERSEETISKYTDIVGTMKNLLNYQNVNFTQIFTDANAAETIEIVMGRVKPDWLAFEHDSKSFFERMVDNYNTKRLILQSEIPVLVF